MSEAVESQDKRICVFISHRHDDVEIADVLRSAVEDWTSNRVTVFQSSRAGKGPCTGGDLGEELKKQLAESCLVLLVYVVGDERATYCMYECGMATNPRIDDTRVVVFQCGNDVPAPLESKVRVKVDLEDIRKFTRDFHTKKRYFPECTKALADVMGGHVDEALLEKRAQRLFAELEAVVPEEPPKEDRLWHRLVLSMGSDHVRAIKEQSFQESLSSRTLGLIEGECQVTKASDGATLHFGLARLQQGSKLIDLYRSWQHDTENKRDWFSELGTAMNRALHNKPAIEVTTPMNSASEKARWYLPVLSCVRTVPERRCYEFDVDLIRVLGRPEPMKVGVAAVEDDREAPQKG